MNFKKGDIVEFSNAAYRQWIDMDRLYWFSEYFKFKYTTADELRVLCRELRFRVVNVQATQLYVEFCNGDKIETFGLNAWKFVPLGSEVPEARIDPVLARINKLYRKCKTTKHWTVNDKLCSA